MAISKELVIKVVADFDAEESELEKAMQEIEDGAKAMTEQFGAAAANAHKAFDTIGLGAENQVSRVTKLHSAFQGFTGVLGQGISAVDEFAKTLGPWNQVLELGGKAVKFVSDGLEAYAKTSPQARAEVEKLTKELSGMKDAAMAAFGAVAVEALKPLPSIKELERQMRGLEGVFEDAFKAYSGKGATAARGIESVFGGGAFRGIASQFRDDWNTGPSPDELLGRVGERIARIKEEQKKAAETAKAWRAELAALSSKEATRLTDDLLKRLEDEGPSSIVDQGGFNLPKAPDLSDLDLQAPLNKLNKLNQNEKNKNFLESHFGKLEEFDAYASAFGVLTTATTSAMEAWISGSMSLGDAIEAGVGRALAADATLLAGQVIKHGVYAIGSLAFGDVAGATTHGIAAAKAAAGALALGGLAKTLGTGGGASSAQGAGGGGGGGGGRADGGPVTAPGSGEHTSQGVEKVTYVVAYDDAFAQGSDKMRTRRAERIVARVKGGAGWSND